MTPLYTIAQVAERLGLSDKSVLRTTAARLDIDPTRGGTSKETP